MSSVRALVAAALLSARPSRSQFPDGSLHAQQMLDAAESDLFEQTTSYPEQRPVETFFHPTKYALPVDNYVFAPPQSREGASPPLHEYTQNVIFDPCRGYAAGCCMNNFGTPEWELISADPAAADYGSRRRVLADGSTLKPENSRRPTEELVLDETCTGKNAPPGRVDCLMPRVARSVPARFPQCWNWNESVVADAGCRAPHDGTPLQLCLEVGFTQTAHIAQCGGAFRDDAHCGTFLEVHRQGRAEILAETRLPRVDTSGYQMTVISTTHLANETHTLCYDPLLRGAYEVWWVVRTRYNFVVELRVPFGVISPLCDFDADNNRYFQHATVGAAPRLADFSNFDARTRVFKQPLQWSTLLDATGAPRPRTLALLNPFAPESQLYTQPRPEGEKPSKPGVGMGGTFVKKGNDSFAQLQLREDGSIQPTPIEPEFSAFLWGNTFTYSWRPQQLPYSVATGALTPTTEGAALLAEMIAQRGYSRRRLEPPEPLTGGDLAAWRAAKTHSPATAAGASDADDDQRNAATALPTAERGREPTDQDRAEWASLNGEGR